MKQSRTVPKPNFSTGTIKFNLDLKLRSFESLFLFFDQNTSAKQNSSLQNQFNFYHTCFQTAGTAIMMQVYADWSDSRARAGNHRF